MLWQNFSQFSDKKSKERKFLISFKAFLHQAGLFLIMKTNNKHTHTHTHTHTQEILKKKNQLFPPTHIRTYLISFSEYHWFFSHLFEKKPFSSSPNPTLLGRAGIYLIFNTNKVGKWLEARRRVWERWFIQYYSWKILKSFFLFFYFFSLQKKKKKEKDNKSKIDWTNKGQKILGFEFLLWDLWVH